MCLLAARWTDATARYFSLLDAMRRAGRNIWPSVQFTNGAPAKPVWLAFGALFIKQRLGLSDEKSAVQIRINA